MRDAAPPQQLRAEWRDRLRLACNQAAEQVDTLGMADLRAFRTTIEEEMDRIAERLPTPGPVETKGPMTAEEQAQYVQEALQYNALQVRKQVADHELRHRTLGPDAAEATVPDETRHLAALAWDVMGEAEVDTTEAVYREVARRANEEYHLTTVEMWLRDRNPHHPEGTEGRWTELRRAVLLASA